MRAVGGRSWSGVKWGGNFVSARAWRIGWSGSSGGRGRVGGISVVLGMNNV